MNSIYAQKFSPTPKASTPSAESILDSSAQNESLQRKADMTNNATLEHKADVMKKKAMQFKSSSFIEKTSESLKANTIQRQKVLQRVVEYWPIGPGNILGQTTQTEPTIDNRRIVGYWRCPNLTAGGNALYKTFNDAETEAKNNLINSGHNNLRGYKMHQNGSNYYKLYWNSINNNTIPALIYDINHTTGMPQLEKISPHATTPYKNVKHLHIGTFTYNDMSIENLRTDSYCNSLVENGYQRISPPDHYLIKPRG